MAPGKRNWVSNIQSTSAKATADMQGISKAKALRQDNYRQDD